MFNLHVIAGRLGRDPELKYAQSGTAICKFSVATTDSVKKGDSWESETEWHNVVCFGNTAESCSKFLKKGSLALIQGKKKTNEYTTKEGEEKRFVELVAHQVRFLDTKATQEKPESVAEKLTVDDEDNDLPF